jgi:ubiquinone biosynthesis protein Coq4
MFYQRNSIQFNYLILMGQFNSRVDSNKSNTKQIYQLDNTHTKNTQKKKIFKQVAKNLFKRPILQQQQHHFISLFCCCCCCRRRRRRRLFVLPS